MNRPTFVNYDHALPCARCSGPIEPGEMYTYSKARYDAERARMQPQKSSEPIHLMQCEPVTAGAAT